MRPGRGTHGERSHTTTAPPAALSRAIAAIVLGLLAVVLPRVPALAEVVATESPLVVTIDSLTPGTLPKSGPIRVTGTVTNTTAETWTAVRVRPFISSTPMTTTTELAASATVPETADVGGRITEALEPAIVGDLAPGQTASYTLSIPSKVIRQEILRRTGAKIAEGVYWFGVHAMDGSDDFADGRARTFLPNVSDTTAPVRTALIVPLRGHVQRAPDGAVDELDRWVRLLQPDGRLAKLLTIGLATPFGQRLTWLVDPAVLDAVQQLADGNPPRSIASTKSSEGPEQTPTDSSSPSESSSPSATPSPSAETAEAQALASTWLPQMLDVLGASDVLALPYGDLDLTATAHHGRSLYEPAHARSVAAFEALGITATQVDAPAGGVVDAVTLSLPSSTTPVLVSDEALPETPDGPGPVVADAEGTRLVISSAAALDGGPGPGDRQAVVPLRQRLLAEAAVRALDPARPPLVVKLAASWTPKDPEEFASGLQAPWFDLVGMPAATAAQPGPEVARTALRYSAGDEEAELAPGRFAAATRLIDEGATLQRVLTDNDQVAGELSDEALTGISFLARGTTLDPAVLTERWVEDRLSQIQVQAPVAQTLSGSSGKFPATIVNGLDQPVTVKLATSSDSGIVIEPLDKLELAAGGQASVLVEAHAARAGVHRVTLTVTDTQGNPLGSAVTVPVRAAQVSGIIWLFIAVGASLLFGTIGVRLFRRVRAAASEPSEPRDER